MVIPEAPELGVWGAFLSQMEGFLLAGLPVSPWDAFPLPKMGPLGLSTGALAGRRTASTTDRLCSNDGPAE